jgi:hypothetical protein
MRRARKRAAAACKISIEEEIAQLRDLDLSGLRLRWRNTFGKPAPEHLSRFLLFRVIAYRLQADRIGDLDHETLKVLARAVGQADQPSRLPTELIKLDQKRFVPPPGTVLVREWDRASHRVLVMPDGFAWNGKTFDSLSKVALAITGTKWNGPRFFGLRDKQSGFNAGEDILAALIEQQDCSCSTGLLLRTERCCWGQWRRTGAKDRTPHAA